MAVQRVACLDGLRGLAAVWVIVGHAALLTGTHIPLLDAPDLGVDLFIMLSGFLMVYQFTLRRAREPWASPRTWAAFWLRRWFRIAPLYYVALAVALVAGAALFDARSMIDAHLGLAGPDRNRYLDHGLTNVAMHISFLFGLVPNYAFRTPLPDWSLGLEMQFYAAFPFLALLLQRFGWIRGAIVLAVAAFGIAGLIHVLGIRFPMPTFLPIKLNLFLGGMLLAAAAVTDRRLLYLAVAATIVFVPGADFGLDRRLPRLAIILLFFSVLYPEDLWTPLRVLANRGARILSGRLFNQLGELSYGAYLFHLLIMIPFAAMAWKIFPANESVALRLLATFTPTIIITYCAAAAGYYSFERWGQAAGRRVVGSLFGAPVARSTEPEAISAP